MFTLARVECARRPAVVPALLCLCCLSAGEAAAGVDHPAPGNLPTGEALCGTTLAWVAIVFATVVLLPRLVVEEERGQWDARFLSYVASDQATTAFSNLLYHLLPLLVVLRETLGKIKKSR